VRGCGALVLFHIHLEALMRNSHASIGAAIAGALLLAVPVLHMILGAGAPGAVDAIVGLFGLILLAVSATYGATWPDGSSRARPYRIPEGEVSRAGPFAGRSSPAS
jgi:hypothetical protein